MFYILSASLWIYAKNIWNKTIPGKSVRNDDYWVVWTAPSVGRASLQSNLSFSMCACTDLHSAFMFPSPKPVAPLRSISSKKKVSSAKMGLVNTWRRYLEMEIIWVTEYRTVSALLLLCFTVNLSILEPYARQRKNCILISVQHLHFVSHLLFPLDPDCNEGTWCKLVSRRMPCCARIWGLCPASSISCCFPACHARKQNELDRLIKWAKNP